MTATQDATIAELQRTNAELRRERDAALSEKATLTEELGARDATLAQRNTEYSERIEHQAATVDVLKAMSASPDDPQPVFDLIVERARDLCDAHSAGVYGFDGTLVQLRAATGVENDPERQKAFTALYPRPPTRDFHPGRAILDRQIVRIDDVESEPGLSPLYRRFTNQSGVAVPLLRDGVAIGALGLGRRERGGFSDSQVALLQTFAEQAVIAITSAETYRALQTRTNDLQESLEYQTATSDVLKVISGSEFDLAPVFQAVVETAARLCRADQATIYRYQDGDYRWASGTSMLPDYERIERGVRIRPGTGTLVGRVALERRIVQIPDAWTDPLYEVKDDARVGGIRTLLGVPLLRDGAPIGVIGLGRRQIEPFTQRQIELVSTFADQAVIAIENTRLITGQREALEQQTATADVLGVINSSPGDLAPVFDAMLEKALRLCDAAFGTLLTFDGDQFHTAAQRGLPARYVEYLAATPQPGPGGGQQRVLRGERFVQFTDMKDDEAYRSGANPTHRAMVDLGGARTGLIVPLRKDDALVGIFTIYRQEVRAFSDKQIALLENFAAQAVIAMENARLITDQREALEQQTATAEVLQVINASPGNLAPVFNAMLDRAMRLCDGAQGTLWMFDGERMRASATAGYSSELAEQLSEWRDIHPFQRRLSQGERVFQIVDLAAEELYQLGNPLTRAAVDVAGIRTVVFVALVKDAATLGGFTISRREIRAFSDKHISLLQNFAEQAVIAIENARLITEQREALEQQAATTEVLEVINASPGDLVPVFDQMLEKALRLGECAFGILVTYDGKALNHVAMRGVTPELAEVLREPYRPTPGQAIYRIVYGGENVVHDANILDDEAYRGGHPNRRAMADLGGARTQLLVALRKEHALRGIFCVYRQEVRPFTDKQVALLENFAAQAVIAMENARLITETREALEQQTATAEVLQVINASPGNLAPVFDAILEKAHSLCDIALGSLELYDGERFRAVAVRGSSDAFADMLRLGYPASDNPATRPLIEGSRFSHIHDLAETDYSITQSAVELNAARTLLCVPLRRDETLLGMIASARGEVRPFSEKEIALLENFAAQAVIAIENARLLNEQREALEQQTAVAEVLQVINASPGNLTPVFDAMLEKAMRLCGAAFGLLYTYDGELFHTVAHRGVPAALAEFRTRHPPLGRPGGSAAPLIETKRPVHIVDMMEQEFYRAGDAINRATVDLGGARTTLTVPLLKDDALLGVISIYRQEVRAFSAKQIALLENFAAQAVISMENARLLNEIRQRQEELRVTFENMGDGVAMFGTDLRLAAWNRNFQQILDLPDELLAERPSSTDFVRYLATHGEYGVVDVEGEVQRVTAAVGTQWSTERTRPDGRVIELRNNPVPGGGFVLIYADITERKRNEAEIRAARDAAEEASRTIEAAYRELKTAQANLIQAEKMASLGQLTAGIAHEIKNPLNFVNNFAALSVDLLSELKETAAPGFAALTERQRAEVEDVSAMLTSNLEKITEHGKRADSIVKAMLEHSRGSSGERRMVDLNALIDEALNLAYHGARAQDQSFNITLERDFGDGIAPIEVNPQDITRVFLNIFANGFYATTRRAREGGDAGFVPTLKVTTIDAGEAVEIRVRDNGTGIPADIRDKLFQPFFTTKPTGEGTGLGLSITYDIVTQQHGGSIAVDSKVGDHSEFTIRLPRNP